MAVNFIGLNLMSCLVILSSRQLAHVINMQAQLTQIRVIVLLSHKEHQTISAEYPNCDFEFYPVDISQNDGVLWEYDERQCSEVLSKVRNQKVSLLTLDEGNLLLCARLRERFNIDGPKVPDIAPYRDKLLMKDVITKAGISSPRCSSLNSMRLGEDVTTIAERFGSTIVIKPSSSAGSNNVNIVSDQESFDKATSEAMSAGDHYEIEQYISGKHYHCDTIFRGDECVFVACTECVHPTIDFQSGKPLGGSVLHPNSEIAQKLVETAIQVVEALGVSTTAQHTELIVEEDGNIVFLESGARPPGMLVVDTYERAFGVNIVELIVRDVVSNLLGTNFTTVEIDNSKFQDAFYLVYPKQVGKVQKLHPAPAILDAQIELTHACKIGDVHSGCHSNLDFTTTVLSVPGKKPMVAIYEQMKLFNPVTYHVA